jgi:type IV secretory pathway protease TraF
VRASVPIAAASVLLGLPGSRVCVTENRAMGEANGTLVTLVVKPIRDRKGRVLGDLVAVTGIAGEYRK